MEVADRIGRLAGASKAGFAHIEQAIQIGVAREIGGRPVVAGVGWSAGVVAEAGDGQFGVTGVFYLVGEGHRVACGDVHAGCNVGVVVVDELGEIQPAHNTEVVRRVKVAHGVGGRGNRLTFGNYPVGVLAVGGGEAGGFVQPGFAEVEAVVAVGIATEVGGAEVIAGVQRCAVVVGDGDAREWHGATTCGDLVGEGHRIAGVDVEAGSGLGVVAVHKLPNVDVGVGGRCFHGRTVQVVNWNAGANALSGYRRGVENIFDHVGGGADVGDVLAHAKVTKEGWCLVTRVLHVVVNRDVGEYLKAGVDHRDTPGDGVGERHDDGFYPAVGRVERVTVGVTDTEGAVADLFDDLDVGIAAETEVDRHIGEVVVGVRVAEVEDVLANGLLAQWWVQDGVGAQDYWSRGGVAEARIECLLVHIFVVIVVGGEGQDGLGPGVQRAAREFGVGDSHLVGALQEVDKHIATVGVGGGVVYEDERARAIVDPELDGGSLDGNVHAVGELAVHVSVEEDKVAKVHGQNLHQHLVRADECRAGLEGVRNSDVALRQQHVGLHKPNSGGVGVREVTGCGADGELCLGAPVDGAGGQVVYSRISIVGNVVGVVVGVVPSAAGNLRGAIGQCGGRRGHPVGELVRAAVAGVELGALVQWVC
ncbi:hypothetical protein GQR58_030032 [Nymphon striatum]|nr:hypothetical protein GQR58_030032 [Nymphon striatum]